MKELRFQKDLTLINQINQKSAWFVIVGISNVLVIDLNHMSVMDVMIYHWSLMN